jgi:DNA-binding ferritin-like protein (oxidative damage protectant)
VSGSHFRDYHILFDEQAEQIFAMIDPLAERVRKLGGITIHSVGEVSKLQRIADDNAPFVEPEKMLTILMNDNKSFSKYLQEAHKVCEKYNDVATCSVLEVFIDETERRVWFLFETQA